MRKLISIVATILVMTGCASSGESGFSSQDINFAEQMIPHHQQALEMSDFALANSSNPEILALAEQIKGAQDPEIKLMSGWPGVDPTTHAGHAMSGMLSEDEMNELEQARGSEFDQLFLIGMIKHHQGAIDMARMVIDSENKEVSDLARAIIEAQENEIELMKALLGKL